MILLTVIIAGITVLGLLGDYSYFGESGARFDQSSCPPAYLLVIGGGVLGEDDA